MSLHYHEKALDLIHRSAERSDESLRQLNQLEEALKIQLSPSFREWYSLKDARDILSTYSNQDHVIAIDEMRDIEHQDDKTLLEFIAENQGVAYWAVEIGVGDDPPVWVRLSHQKTWTISSPTFSEFIFAWLWDYQFMAEEWFHAWGSFSYAKILTFAREHLHETVSNHMNGDDTTYRFWDTNMEQRLDIQHRWNIEIVRFSAREEGAFLELVRRFLSILPDHARTTLSAWNDKTQAALRKIETV